MRNYITEKEMDGEISTSLLYKLNFFIRTIGYIFRIHCFTKGIHSKNSVHPEGLACDGSAVRPATDRFPDELDTRNLHNRLDELLIKRDKSLFEQAVLAYLCDFSGIGMYPHWALKGLHLDISEKDNRPLQWIGLNKSKVQKEIEKTEGSQIYIYL
jgi:hypothetical protein